MVRGGTNRQRGLIRLKGPLTTLPTRTFSLASAWEMTPAWFLPAHLALPGSLEKSLRLQTPRLLGARRSLT